MSSGRGRSHPRPERLLTTTRPALSCDAEMHGLRRWPVTSFLFAPFRESPIWRLAHGTSWIGAALVDGRTACRWTRRRAALRLQARSRSLRPAPRQLLRQPHVEPVADDAGLGRHALRPDARLHAVLRL